MTGHGDSKLIGADIRAKLNHPTVDSDGHMMECTFAILDFVKQVGGPKMAKRYEDAMVHENKTRGRRAVWVGSAGTSGSS